MRSVDEILEQAKRLSPRERDELVRKLTDAKSAQADVTTASERGPYAPLLELAGSAHSEFGDVARDKNRHLADIYADRHGER